MFLTGTFHRSVDDKHRVSIPKRIRAGLSKEAGDGIYVAPGTDGSLAIYSEGAFSEVAKKLAAGSPTGQETRAFSRLFYAQAQRLEMDSQGRVRLPQELVELAGLGKEAVLVGVGDHLELWQVERWESYRTEKQARFDQLAEQAFEQS